ncbi:MAG TPA: glycosyltransferase [Candidatus Acidoferrum sp.]|nr:glycosyltransferase [Candidatus Acidoferrum sp.]
MSMASRSIAGENKTSDQPVLNDVGILALVPDQWSSRWMVRHHIMARLGRYFHMVWVNPAHHWRDSFKAAAVPQPSDADQYPGFTEYTPERWLPDFYRPAWLAKFLLRQRLLNAIQVLRDRGCTKIILYLWRPEFEPVLRMVPFDLSCYHLEDEYSFSRVERPTDPVEAKLLSEVDRVFILSPALYEKKGKLNPHTHYLPGAVDFAAYSQSLPEPKDLAPIPHPRIGYVGSLKWQIDWNLLLKLSSEHPEWSFVLVGPPSPHPEIDAALNEMKRRSNVNFLGGKPSTEMMVYPQHFDVCIMPYGDNDYTKYIYPLKLHEYLAGGKPLVGTPIATLAPLGDVVLLPKTAEEWSPAIQKALSAAENTAERRSARQNFAKQHDWWVLVQNISETLAQQLGSEYADRLARHFQEKQRAATPAETVAL